MAEVSHLLGGEPTYQRVAEDGFDAGAYVKLPAIVLLRAFSSCGLGESSAGGRKATDIPLLQLDFL